MNFNPNQFIYMKKNIKKFLILSFITLFIALGEANAANVAVLDVENVLKNSLVAKDIQSQLSAKLKEFQAEIDQKQTELEAEGKKLDSKKSVLSESAFQNEQDEFEKKINKVKYTIDERQNSLKSAAKKALDQVNEKINIIISDITKEQKIDLIVPAAQTIFYAESIDISSEVLKRLNKAITKVKVEFDK